MLVQVGGFWIGDDVVQVAGGTLGHLYRHLKRCFVQRLSLSKDSEDDALWPAVLIR